STLILGGLLLLKKAAFKGAIVGSLWLVPDEDADDESTLVMASQMDELDCAKRAVCEVNALAGDELRAEDAMIVRLFNNSSSSLEDSKESIEFRIAATIGKSVGAKGCSIIYERCPYGRKELLEVIRSPQDPTNGF
ncbi:Uncharacterized protein FKW44_013443, partial [Caligus rogercresseyi]